MPVRKAQPIVVHSKATLREAARAAVHEAHGHFAENAQQLRIESTAELIHQTRVGVRRLRVFLRLFRSLWDKGRAAHASDELRWLFQLLGRARDYQVLGEVTLGKLRLTPAVQTALRKRCAEHVWLAHNELEQALRSTRFEALQRALVTLLEQLDKANGKGKPAASWLARRLSRGRKRVLRDGKTLHGKGERLHELRKELKKLRYMSDLIEPLFEPSKKRRRVYTQALKGLQDVLGDFNDLQVARRLLPKLARSAGASAGLRTQLDALLVAQREHILPSYEMFAAVKPIWR